jgi:multiple sugar transport system substrate-binding protein
MKIAQFKFRWRWVILMVCLTAGSGCDFRRDSRANIRESEADRVFRILLVGDPFAIAVSRGRAEIERHLGMPVELEIVGYSDGRKLTLLNARDAVSRFDLVAFDVVWLGEYHANRILKDLSGRLNIDREAFLENALEACEKNGALYGLPIQPHSELLWVRTDLLEATGMEPPVTTEDLLAFARRVHDPSRQMYGLAWNAQRGQPLGQTMAHLFAAFGAELLDENGRPAFYSEKGLEAARFVKSLIEVSPPDIYSMAWDQRTTRFASGQVAMTYGWGARAFMAEDEPYSVVRGKVMYLPAPHAPGREPVTPLGVWAMGIPSNVASFERSAGGLEILFSPEVQELLVNKGNSSPGLRALASNPALQERFPVLATMAELDRLDQLRMEMRPRIPEWDALCGILGTAFHDMILGKVSAEEAMDRSFTEAVSLFNEASARSSAE